jgi:hypothetical protein
VRNRFQSWTLSPAGPGICENDVFAIGTALDGMFGTGSDPYEILAARTEMHVNEHLSSVSKTLRIELSSIASNGLSSPTKP